MENCLIRLGISKLLLFLLSLLAVDSFGQKPVIDLNAIKAWPSISNGLISDQGHYITYDEWVGGHFNATVIKRIDGPVIYKIGKRINVFITADERFAIFESGQDSLAVLTMNTSAISFIPNVVRFQLLANGKEQNLFYQTSSDQHNAFIIDFASGHVKDLGTVRDIFITSGSDEIVLFKDSLLLGKKSRIVEWLKPGQSWSKTVWSTDNMNLVASNFVIDDAGSRLAFLVRNLKQSANWSICFCTKTSAYSVLASTNDLNYKFNEIQLEGIKRFSYDGKRLLISVRPILKQDSTRSKFNVKLTVWTYRDTSLQSYQKSVSRFSGGGPELLAALNISDKTIVRLNRKNEQVDFPALNDSLCLTTISRYAGSDISGDELGINPELGKEVYMVSCTTGRRKRLPGIEQSAWYNRYLSPNGKFIVYYDGRKGSFFSYEISSGATHKLRSGSACRWTRYQDDHVDSSDRIYGISAWLGNDAAFLINDQFDIWSIDPTGKKEAKSLTNGFGKKHGIFLELIDGQLPLITGKRCLLSAFDRKTKSNGFFSAVIGSGSDPISLSMENALFYAPNAFSVQKGEEQFVPKKASNSTTWLVNKMTARQSPNYFITKDFKTFSPVTDTHPELKYNWLSCELHSFKTSAGEMLEGLLYKPRNFDPHKKYPVVVHYYEKKADGLNVFMPPEISGGDMNIPSFVSSGYLVFEPDIHYRPGRVGQCALNSVLAAYQFLSKQKFVDAKKIGIQGHSFGGMLTNYIVTHTNLFAAACSSSGMADWVSMYGSLIGKVESSENYFENSQPRMKKTLWENRKLYIENSPIYNVNKVITPLLLKQGRNDAISLFDNTLEFYIALRRLKKLAWLLEYENDTHVLRGESAEDYTIRMAQFFDYYLKDKTPPKWMTQGIPYGAKNFDNGLALDYSGKKP